jgi:hypothetical protein
MLLSRHQNVGQNQDMNEWMFIDHSIDPYMGRSPTGCRARPNTQWT